MRDEAGELPVAPVPHLLGSNGTFMVYRKLHQNVATFRAYLEEHGAHYAGGKEKLAAKFVGRWRDGTPVELSPERPDPALVADPAAQHRLHLWRRWGRSALSRWALTSRRVHPRDAFGFNGKLVNRRRITRRGPALWDATRRKDQPVARRRRAWRDLHGAERQHLPPVRIRAPTMDRVRQRCAAGERQGS